VIRLLTFNRLSLLREDRDENGLVTGALDQLSSTAKTFDCHLLQRPAGECVLDALGEASQQTRLHSVTGNGGCDVMQVMAQRDVELNFPEWMQPSVLTHQPVEFVHERMMRASDDSCDLRLQWTHVELPDDGARIVWLDGLLKAAAMVSRAFSDDRLIVTAIAGEERQTSRFESLLWEEQVRLPLFIAGKGIGCERVNCQTGSFDVLETVLAELGDTRTDPEEDSPFSLTDAQRENCLRSIYLSQGTTDAVRTADFMLVRSSSGMSDEQVALYGKPCDVWNVHDLSREYPDVTDRLLAQLEDHLPS